MPNSPKAVDLNSRACIEWSAVSKYAIERKA